VPSEPANDDAPIAGRLPSREVPERPGVLGVPAALSPLVGREGELVALTALLGDPAVRLLTLTGPGGVGKTRLAIEVATELAEEHTHGAAVVGLAALDDSALVAPAILRALEHDERSDRPAAEQLAGALRDRQLLLVLDNLEHLLPAAPMLTELLAACPGLTILATSRSRLRLRGEHEVPVVPLAVPAPGDLPPLPRLAELGAIRLWCDRARAANPAFALTAVNAATVTEVCRRLDGLPLAIELAAAWSRVLSPASILRRLERRLHLLTGGPRDAPARHQTMREAIAWSYDLLDPAERALLIRLAVFTGGFTADSAEQVWTSLPPVQPTGSGGEAEVPTLLSSLVDKALLQPRVNAEGEPRLVMLETVREFGLEQLTRAGEDDAARAAHAAHFQAFAETAGPALQGPDWKVWFDRIEVDIGNIRAALTWLRDCCRGEDALRLTNALGWFWTDANYVTEGRRWYDALLATADPIERRLRAAALSASGELAYWQQDTDRAQERFAAALALWREIGEPGPTGDALVGLAGASMERERYSDAKRYLDQALALSDATANEWQAARIRHHLGHLAVIQGDWRLARTWYEQALRIWRDLGHESRILVALNSLGWAYLMGGDLVKAWDSYDAVLTRFLEQEFDYRLYHADCFVGVALIAGAAGSWEVAARLAAVAAGLRASQGLPNFPHTQRVLDERIAAWEAALGSAAFAKSWATGLQLDRDAAVAEARAVPRPLPADAIGLSPREREVLALLAEGASDPEIAARLFISRRTASNHVHAILGKLGVASRSAAAAAAVRRGLG
jgi:predicted ATPase/DNA-binding CsgD family transcriptional regulator